MWSDLAKYYNEMFHAQPAGINLIMQHIPKNNYAKVLDIGCGGGAYPHALAKNGYAILAIDFDPEMIALAKKQQTTAEFIQMDIKNIANIKQKIYAAYSFGNVLSFLNKAELQNFSKNIAQMIPKNARIIIQIENWNYINKLKYYTFPDLQNKTKTFTFKRKYINISEETVTFETRMQADGQRETVSQLTMYPHQSKTIIDTFNNNQFALKTHTADFLGTKYDPNKDSATIFIFEKL